MQPFGGAGPVGTGPKAGGPLYLAPAACAYARPGAAGDGALAVTGSDENPRRGCRFSGFLEWLDGAGREVC